MLTRFSFLLTWVGLLFISLVCGSVSLGAVTTWQPVGGSTDYNAPGNWTNSLPGPGNDGQILNVGTVSINVSATVSTAGQLVIFGATGTTNLTIQPAISLALTGFYIGGAPVTQAGTGTIEANIEMATGEGAGNIGSYLLKNGSIIINAPPPRPVPLSASAILVGLEPLLRPVEP